MERRRCLGRDISYVFVCNLFGVSPASLRPGSTESYGENASEVPVIALMLRLGMEGGDAASLVVGAKG
jgi:hypothetical protein